MYDYDFEEIEKRHHQDERDGGVDHQDFVAGKKQDVELYMRTYTTMLRSTGEVKVKALEQAHLNSDSALHVNARRKHPDISAFLYCIQRLPSSIMYVRRVLLGQSEEVFNKHGFPVEKWEPVSAPGRRRRWEWDGKENLAVYVSSASDVDDLVPTLTGFQIEWNKFHMLLNEDPNTRDLLATIHTTPPALLNEVTRVIQSRLLIGVEDWGRLHAIWGERLWDNLRLMAEAEKSFTLRMLGGTYVGYAKATEQWWAPVERLLESSGLTDRPVYFVSSNTHSLVNLLGGSVLRAREHIERFIVDTNDPELTIEYNKLLSGAVRSSLENMLYYASRRFYSESKVGRDMYADKEQEERQRGIYHIKSREGMPIDVQVIELARLNPQEFDPRIKSRDNERLSKSPAIIVNIDYPLGLAAYYIFVQVSTSLENIRGVYVLGKAATLNGRIGDVMVSDSVYDEHTKNTYWLDNCFTAAEVAPFLVHGSVLDNQKAVTVMGTYLQNRSYLDDYYRENYTVVEMEAGPYLNALYEYTYPTRHPNDQHINFTKLPIDLGFLHYGSDTPFTRGKNLGAIRLAYLGMDSAYATSVAIVRRILDLELATIPETPPGNGRKDEKLDRPPKRKDTRPTPV
ncbi:MAG TPA: hypothetical protein VFR15_11775 [Chloroflexia bacterium]|nr:hypothetical protein [Chloroflexia bacterium]